MGERVVQAGRAPCADLSVHTVEVRRQAPCPGRNAARRDNDTLRPKQVARRCPEGHSPECGSQVDSENRARLCTGQNRQPAWCSKSSAPRTLKVRHPTTPHTGQLAGYWSATDDFPSSVENKEPICRRPGCTRSTASITPGLVPEQSKRRPIVEVSGPRTPGSHIRPSTSGEASQSRGSILLGPGCILGSDVVKKPSVARIFLYLESAADHVLHDDPCSPGRRSVWDLASPGSIGFGAPTRSYGVLKKTKMAAGSLSKPYLLSPAAERSRAWGPWPQLEQGYLIL
ncbi:hypothetical protein RR46_05737 [Papilio xuthus]|uniref:Uncharacterized protein n=1 Tax=Papilio xuthus TaxID=66420 RepID=A0A194PTM3_PAPXU|nr:hypothetical protein RR46_05737 [Papilio xuthus]